MSAGVATLVRRLHECAGDMRVYRLEPPLAYTRWDYEADADVTRHAEYVAVSATVVSAGTWSRLETYAFPATATGAVTDWLELPCSENGCLDHAKVLRNAGYEVQS